MKILLKPIALAALLSLLLLTPSILTLSGRLGTNTETIPSFLISSPFQPAAADSAVLSTTGNDASTDPPRPQIASDGSGNIYVVWQSFNSGTGTNDVVFAEKAPGLDEFQFTDPLATTENNLNNPPRPQIASDSSGNIYVVWQASNSSSSSMDVMFSTRPSGSDEFSIGIGDNGASLNPGAEDDSDKYPDIAIDSSTGNIYVAWVQDGEIVVANSTNGGIEFDTTVAVTADEIDDNPSNVQVSAGDSGSGSGSGNSIYLAWQDQSDETSSIDIFFSKSTNEGISYDAPVNLSQTDQESILPVLFASEDGQTITIAWQELVEPESEGATPAYDILTIQSSNGGGEFGDSSNLTNTEGVDSINPSIGFSPDRSKMFLAWEELSFVTLTSSFFVAFSDDAGGSLACPAKVGSTTDFSGGNIAIVGDDTNTAFAVWEEVNPETFTTSDIIFFDDLGYQTPYVTVELESENVDSDFDGVVEAKWGIESDTVTVSGRIANADEGNGDFVRVDWGDGVNTDDVTISLSNCTWEATSNLYDQASAGLGIVQISASLLDGSSEDPLASAETPISLLIKSHTTELTLDPIPSVINGDDVSVTGTLQDQDTGDGIQGMSIIFSGSGADFGLSSVSPVTDSDGAFFVSAASSPDVGNEWQVLAQFAGDVGFEFSDSELQFYDTVSANASAIDITETGSNVEVEVPDFDATVIFEEIESLVDGKLYVTQCSPSDSSRFAALIDDNAGTCLEISPGVQMAPGSSAAVTMSYANATIPDGYDETDVDIFHATTPDGNTFVDISQSRDTAANTISGTTTFFGVFVVGAAIHADPASDDSVRQQIYIGDGNTVEFRDVDDPTNSTADIDLNKSSYRVTETATLTISDNGNANHYPDVEDTVTAGVWSPTSGEDGGITITLTETDVDTGTFTGTFTFTNTGSSSGSTLLVSNRDELNVTYEEPFGGRLRAVFDGVIESGLVEMSDFEVLPDSTPFSALGYPVSLKLVDAQVDPEGSLSVTLSYANADLAGSDERYIRLYQGEDLGDGTANWNAEPISTADGDGFTVGLDSNAKTITATTAITQGVFLLGFDIGSPGGSGGGLGRPGTGLVVDFVASIAQQSSGSGGGGGGGAISPTPSTTPPPGTGATSESSEVPSGESVTSSVDIEGSAQNLELVFHDVVTGGTITTKQQSPSDFSTLFSSIQPGVSPQGLAPLEGSTTATVGSVFEIQPSAGMQFGDVQITIPYDEAQVLASGASENDVRFLHYNGNAWEDVTIAIDTDLNTVTGLLHSLSPVVASVIDDGSFGSAYLQANPLAGVAVRDPFIHAVTGVNNSISVGDNVEIGATIANLNRSDRAYSSIVQIQDEKGAVVSIIWSTDNALVRGETANMITNLIPASSGDYTATIFIVDGGPDGAGPLNFLSQKVSLATIHVQN